MERFVGLPMPSKSSSQRSALLVARVIWAAGFILMLGLTVANLVRGDALRALANEWMVGLGQPTATALVPPETFFVYLLTLRLAALTFFWLVALLIFWRRPDDWVALLVSGVLLLMPFSLFLGRDDSPWVTLLTFLSLALFLFLLFVFPDGRFTPRSTQRRILLVIVLLTTPFLSLALAVIFLTEYGPDDQGYFAFLITLFAAMACGIGSQVHRYRFVSKIDERQQTKWVLFGLASQLIWILWGVLLALFLSISNGVINGTSALITLHVFVLVPLLIPLTFGVAMFRDRLWDIDPLINRTLVYGTLTAIIILLYVLFVGAFGVLFQARGNLLVALLATGAIAVAFQPLRERLQQAVDRLMYGERDDPLGMLARLTTELEQADTAETMVPALIETVATVLKFPYVAIWLPGEDGKAREAPLSVSALDTSSHFPCAIIIRSTVAWMSRHARPANSSRTLTGCSWLISPNC